MNWKKPAQFIKARTISFEKKHRPIIIMAVRRGGSTMVSEAISSNRGVWLSNEPFAILPSYKKFNFKRSRLKEVLHSHYFALDGDHLSQFRKYTNELLNAGFPQLGTCRRTKPVLKSDRVCLKVLNAPWMIKWFEAETDAMILPILRHPAAQALSVIRQGWDYPVKAYFYKLEKISESFNQQQINCIQNVLESGDLWQISLLDYVVTTKIIREDYSEVLHRYEDIVRQPEKFVDQVLISQFFLSDREHMLASFRKPSGSSRMSLEETNKAIKHGEVDSVLKSWMRKIDVDQIRLGQTILDHFEVTQYNLWEPY